MNVFSLLRGAAMVNDQVPVTGQVKLVLIGPDGKTKQTEVSNLVVTAGKGYIASRMKDASATAMSHMAVGTTNTAAAAGDTTLAAEVSLSRTALTSTNVSTNVVTYACTFAAGTGTGALVEAGIFNASSSGTMLCRTVFSVINKGASDSLLVTWTVTVG